MVKYNGEGIEARVKRLVLVVFVVFIACAPNLPPEVKPVYTANEILIRVSELQKTTIELYDNQHITKERAELIVTWCVNSAKTLREVPAGWQATIVATWENLVSKIPVPEGGLQTIWELINTLIMSLKTWTVY